MNYQQALQHKKEIVKQVDQLITFRYFEILIVPSKAEDFEMFLEEYKKCPENCNDQTCKKFSTNDQYMVYRFCDGTTLNCREGKM